jgi:DNA invertase Pin-like site-specific DNA recombinase
MGVCHPVSSAGSGPCSAAHCRRAEVRVYGRISTSEYQDPVSSHGWQLEAAQRLVAGRGRIVVEFFDPGASRSVPWAKRPQAAALLAALAEPGRNSDAVVVGEFERAFAGGEARRVSETLASLGVQLWLPEAEGPVDLDEPEHRALLMMLGHQSQREVLRTRFRVRSAMAAQVREQGRHQGGRPPYGYQLVDAGPHPNQVQAGWGRRRHRLEVDPVTAPHVRWIFARRLEGMSAAGIARELNERRIPSRTSQAAGSRPSTRECARHILSETRRGHASGQRPHGIGPSWGDVRPSGLSVYQRSSCPGISSVMRSESCHRRTVLSGPRVSHRPWPLAAAMAFWVMSRP